MMRSGRGQCRADLRVEARFLVRLMVLTGRMLADHRAVLSRESNSSMNANRTVGTRRFMGWRLGERNGHAG